METVPILVAVGTFAFNVVIGLLGYLMRDKLNKMELDLDRAKAEVVHIQVNYAQKADLTLMKDELLDRFDRLEDKLDRIK